MKNILKSAEKSTTNGNKKTAISVGKSVVKNTKTVMSDLMKNLNYNTNQTYKNSLGKLISSQLSDKVNVERIKRPVNYDYYTDKSKKEKFENKYYNYAKKYYDKRKELTPYNNIVKTEVGALNTYAKNNKLSKKSTKYKMLKANIYLEAYTNAQMAADSYQFTMQNVDPSILLFAGAIKSMKYGKEYLGGKIFSSEEISSIENDYGEMNRVRLLDGIKSISFTKYDKLYKESIHNLGKDKVMLGKYDGGGSSSYIAKAGKTYTYFSLGKSWIV